MRVYIHHEVQVDFQSTWSSYRWAGIISDVAASFLNSNSLKSQHNQFILKEAISDEKVKLSYQSGSSE
jgi:hypothetical protein